jgi:hypothetical protein
VELKNLESNNENGMTFDFVLGWWEWYIFLEAKRNKIRKEENPVQEEKFTESKTSEQLASVKSLRSRWEV